MLNLLPERQIARAVGWVLQRQGQRLLARHPRLEIGVALDSRGAGSFAWSHLDRAGVVMLDGIILPRPWIWTLPLLSPDPDCESSCQEGEWNHLAWVLNHRELCFSDALTERSWIFFEAGFRVEDRGIPSFTLPCPSEPRSLELAPRLKHVETVSPKALVDREHTTLPHQANASESTQPASPTERDLEPQTQKPEAQPRLSESANLLQLRLIAEPLLDALAKLKGTGRRRDQLRELLKLRGEAHRLQVAVVGSTSSGKSALVNALMGRELLPQGATPTSNLGVFCSKGANEEVRVVYRGNVEVMSGKSLTPERVRSLCDEAQNRENQLGIQRIEWTSPDCALPEELVLVDSPGLGAIGQGLAPAPPAHEEAAKTEPVSAKSHDLVTLRQLLPGADIVLYLISTKHQLKEAGLPLLESIVQLDQRVLFVLTQKDCQEPDGDGTTVEAKLDGMVVRLKRDIEKIRSRSSLNRLRDHGVAVVSSKMAKSAMGDRNTASWQDSGFDVLVRHLESFAKQLDFLRVERRARRLLGFCDELDKFLGLRSSTAPLEGIHNKREEIIAVDREIREVAKGIEAILPPPRWQSRHWDKEYLLLVWCVEYAHKLGEKGLQQFLIDPDRRGVVERQELAPRMPAAIDTHDEPVAWEPDAPMREFLEMQVRQCRNMYLRPLQELKQRLKEEYHSLQANHIQQDLMAVKEILDCTRLIRGSVAALLKPEDVHDASVSGGRERSDAFYQYARENFPRDFGNFVEQVAPGARRVLLCGPFFPQARRLIAYLAGQHEQALGSCSGTRIVLLGPSADFNQCPEDYALRTSDPALEGMVVATTPSSAIDWNQWDAVGVCLDAGRVRKGVLDDSAFADGLPDGPLFYALGDGAEFGEQLDALVCDTRRWGQRPWFIHQQWDARYTTFTKLAPEIFSKRGSPEELCRLLESSHPVEPFYPPFTKDQVKQSMTNLLAKIQEP